MNPILGKLSELLSPVTTLIDELHTSGEEKLVLKAELARVHYTFLTSALDYETKLAEQQSTIIQTETKSESWITRNWRPISMLTFVSLIVLNWFGFGPAELPADLWFVIKIGLGGYVGGRTIEKVVPPVVAALKSAEQ